MFSIHQVGQKDPNLENLLNKFNENSNATLIPPKKTKPSVKMSIKSKEQTVRNNREKRSAKMLRCEGKLVNKNGKLVPEVKCTTNLVELPKKEKNNNLGLGNPNQANQANLLADILGEVSKSKSNRENEELERLFPREGVHNNLVINGNNRNNNNGNNNNSNNNNSNNNNSNNNNNQPILKIKRKKHTKRRNSVNNATNISLNNILNNVTNNSGYNAENNAPNNKNKNKKPQKKKTKRKYKTIQMNLGDNNAPVIPNVSIKRKKRSKKKTKAKPKQKKSASQKKIKQN